MQILAANILVALEQISVVVSCAFAFVMHRKLKMIWSALLTFGLVVITGVTIFNFFYSFVGVAIGQTNSDTVQLPISYFINQAVYVVGLLAVAVGFAGVALKIK